MKQLNLIFFLLDFVTLNISFYLSIFIVNRSIDYSLNNEIFSLLLFSNLIWALLYGFFPSIKIFRAQTIEKILSKSVKMTNIFSLILILVVYVLNFKSYFQTIVLVFLLLHVVFNLSFKICMLYFIKYLRKNGFNNKNIVIIGLNKTGLEIERILSKEISNGYKVLGYFTVSDINHPNTRVLGHIDDFPEFIENNKVDEIYMAAYEFSEEKTKSIIKLCEKKFIRFKAIPQFSKYTSNRHVNIDFYGNLPVLMLRNEPLENPFNSFVKRFFDIFFSLFVIVFVCSWLFILLAILIKIESKGGVFFSQTRWGKDGKEFKCYKFRSMKVNKDSDNIQATKNDKRITKIGSLLRKTSLDEFPQFFNVLLGNMSIVGPRPHMIKHNIEYSKIIDNYMVRQYAKPGITGWAQVNGFRGETKEDIDMEMRVDYDIWYIENWSLLLDIKIILLTVYNVFKGEENAY